MPQYKYNGSQPISIPVLGLDLKPGDKFESNEKINHSDIELIKPTSKSDKPETPAKEV